MKKIKILSWNIWINGYFKKIKDFLKEADADIVGLQEVKDDDPRLDVISYLKSFGYDYVFAPIEHAWNGKTYINGPATFSKYKIESSKIHNLHEKDNRAAIETKIKIGGKSLTVFNTHLKHTHQKDSNVQTEQAGSLIKFLPSKNAIVLGDLNAIPKSETIKKFQKILVDTDTKSLPTWSVYEDGCGECRQKTVDIKLDYIFVTPDLKTSNFEVGTSKGSDHLPISVMIEL